MIEVTSPIEEEVKKWVPHPKQEKFIRLPFDITEAFFGGHKGPGKTETLVLLPLLYEFHNNSNFRGLYMRRTFADIEREILDRMRKFYPSTGAVLNEQKRRFKWPNGAIMRLGHAEHEQDVREYDTDEYHLICWDELTHFLPFQYQYLSFTRCRSSDPFLPSIIRAAGNPGNVGHLYVRRRFIDPSPLGHRVLKDKKSGLLRVFIPATIEDNPTILQNDPTYLAKLNSLPEAERRAAFGDWYTFSGQVFEEWRIEPFNDEPENARHVINPFVIPSWWPRVIAIDWGWNAPTCIGWAAVSPLGKVFLYRVYNETGKYIPEWIRDFINLTGTEFDTVKKITICHSASQQRGEPETIYQQVNEALKANGISITARLGKRDRIGGKLLVHEYLRWRPKPKLDSRLVFDQELADRIYRNRGTAALNEYLNLFKEENVEILPKLQIFGEGCNPVIDAIPTCVYEEKEGKVSEDVAEFNGDDPYDMLRMLLESVDSYVNESLEEFNERKKLDEIMQEKDMTAFYRRMEYMEAQRPNLGPVNLIHAPRYGVDYSGGVRHMPRRRRF